MLSYTDRLFLPIATLVSAYMVDVSMTMVQNGIHWQKMVSRKCTVGRADVMWVKIALLTVIF